MSNFNKTGTVIEEITSFRTFLFVPQKLVKQEKNPNLQPLNLWQ